MGIFDVNMPLIYGEGLKAFLRLQEEIMRRSDDHSLFAWRGGDDHRCHFECYHGMLANSPAAFGRSGQVYPYSDWKGRKPYGMSNRGLSIELQLTPKVRGVVYAALQCPPLDSGNQNLAIYLGKISGTADQYARVACHELVRTDVRNDATLVYIRQTFTAHRKVAVYPNHYFFLSFLSDRAAHLSRRDRYRVTRCVYDPVSSPQLNAMRRSDLGIPSAIKSDVNLTTVFEINKRARSLAAAVILMRPDRPGEQVAVMLGSSSDYDIGFDVCRSENHQGERNPQLEDYQNLFSPQPMGTAMEVTDLEVCVNARERVESGAKLYLIDIFIGQLKDSSSGYPDLVVTTDDGHSIRTTRPARS